MTLGRFSMNYFLPQAKISQAQGQISIVNERKIFPMFHPAAAVYSNKTRAEFVNGFVKLNKIIRKKS